MSPLSPIISNHMKVVAIVGMAGAGKSEVARQFEDAGFTRIRFGDLTDKEIYRRGLVLNESNERLVREELRRRYGMAAYALLNLPEIDAALLRGHVAVDGLYSWEEYRVMKDRYSANFVTVAVYASPATRYSRLANRAHRKLNFDEAVGRDRTEIENVNKGGPIAMADLTIINESSIEDLRREAAKIADGINNGQGVKA